jgi:hypothetical protein
MELTGLTPGGAFDFCLSNVRRVCAELDIEMDAHSGRGRVGR